MPLDASTLTFAGGFVSFLSGLFLLTYWWQDRLAWVAFWWRLANSGHGIGVSLLALRSVMPFYISNIAAPLLLDLCAAVAFVAARLFNRGSANSYRTIVCVSALITMLIIVGIIAQDQSAGVLGAGTSGGLYAVPSELAPISIT